MMKLIRWLARGAERVLIWCICREAEWRGVDLAIMRTNAKHYVERAWPDAFESVRAANTEIAIGKDRLARRFDIGMALNEAANRVADEKKSLEDHARDSGLTERQIAALKFQRDYLNRITRQ